MNIVKVIEQLYDGYETILISKESVISVNKMRTYGEDENDIAKRDLDEIIIPKNRTGYEINDYDELMDIISQSSDEILSLFGLYGERFGDDEPNYLLSGKTLWLVDRNIFSILPNGINVMTLTGEYEELVKEDFNELINKMPVLPIGFIK